MPGRVLVFDPIVTNRIMLKSQLSIDFFDVTLASDVDVLRAHVRKGKPDIILVAYQADRAAGFETVRWLKSTDATAYIPVVFLQNSEDSTVWDQTHDLMVEDVLNYRASKWLMTTRLNLLIRAKERIDALLAQHRTISDMGFAEQSLSFPPAPSKRICLDISLAKGTFDAGYIAKLTDLLEQDFPNLLLRGDGVSRRSSPPADLYVVDPQTVGADVAFEKMIELRRSEGPRAPSVVFVTPQACQNLVHRALEFSASDVLRPTADVSELASRIRRILWHHDMAHHAEAAVSKHLQSALRDPLTGLYNRRYAQQHLGRLLRDPSKPKSTVTAMVVDLDRFKAINDTFGHLTGDSVIRQAAQRLKQNLRPSDLVARLGGEEFLVVLKDASESRVRSIAKRLHKEIAKRTFLTECGQSIHVSASIGVSATKSNWGAGHDVIDCADIALYRAKNAGRDQVNFSEKAA